MLVILKTQETGAILAIRKKLVGYLILTTNLKLLKIYTEKVDLPRGRLIILMSSRICKKLTK
jgi:hypothetical protein